MAGGPEKPKSFDAVPPFGRMHARHETGASDQVGRLERDAFVELLTCLATYGDRNDLERRDRYASGVLQDAVNDCWEALNAIGESLGEGD